MFERTSLQPERRNMVLPCLALPRNADMTRKTDYDPRASKKEKGSRQLSQNHPKPLHQCTSMSHVTNLTAKVISSAKLSCEQSPHGIMGDTIIIISHSTSPRRLVRCSFGRLLFSIRFFSSGIGVYSSVLSPNRYCITEKSLLLYNFCKQLE